MKNIQFNYVPELGENFLDLFPVRGSYLWAKWPTPDEKPIWYTEDRHLLSDRNILQGSYLYGVRFGKLTNYLLIDIDRGSRYHPAYDRLAIQRILAALEPLGLTKFVPVTSSYTGGIHLYFPFVQAQASHAIARACSALLQANAINPAGGQIELFPHAKRYSADPTLYAGHRLPLQEGSYLLGSDFEPVYGGRAEFVDRWNWAMRGNTVNKAAIEQAIAQFERKDIPFIRKDALKFLNDLNADIEPGWTTYGQTNHILGRIAMREYIFGHLFDGTGKPLEDSRLAERIVEVAEALPGYRRYCRHQHEICKLASDWARSVQESKKYYPYGGKSLVHQKETSSIESWNQQQQKAARERIEIAIATLKAEGTYPATKTARFKAIKAMGVGSDTLYSNKDLWHVDEQPQPLVEQEFPPDQGGCDRVRSLEPSPREEFPSIALISFSTSPESPPTQGGSEAVDSDHGGPGGFSTGDLPQSGPSRIKNLLLRLRLARAAGSATVDGIDQGNQGDQGDQGNQGDQGDQGRNQPPDENWFRSSPLWEGG